MSFQSILGNFALILFVLTILTGVIWFLDVFVWGKQRRLKADQALAEFDTRKARLTSEGIRVEEGGRAELESRMLKQPTWIEYSGSFFPVIALVFFLRSFLYEPFKIPSSSMLPTLFVGDLILVNKFTYGIRLPILNKKIIEINNPQRGDVMVFKYPENPAVDYIKRVIGVPGDKIVYKNKRLSVNGKDVSYEALPDFLDEERLSYSKQFKENLTGVQHSVLNDEQSPAFVRDPHQFPLRELCTYDNEGFSCTVPTGQYFMMGDNRDNSLDSRYWGFVPDQNIVGKAFAIWMNFSHPKRIGSFK
ncbi:signal peptidase I [Undibacterium sp. Jales W-56]|uniref:signal peptidase I n=1 Tax=Undibacterium sp. Jales W-56 TaxID=2897325 RepID=UPI0021CE507C|nr:signal peptidase I [Undibacterium sp. Jales W-56]MCU6433931.1 signal peptidase I [Undibacterium sp. Jales W-56]